jgi:hypothetical protein
MKVVDLENKCLGCGKKFKEFQFVKHNKMVGLDEVNIIIHCAKCRNLIAKKLKLKQKLLDVEFKIFHLTENKTMLEWNEEYGSDSN